MICNCAHISATAAFRNSLPSSLTRTRGVVKGQNSLLTRACATLLADLSLRGVNTTYSKNDRHIPAADSSNTGFAGAAKDPLKLNPKVRQVRDIVI